MNRGSLELQVTCRNLPKGPALFNRSRPFVALNVKDPDTGLFSYKGQTEALTGDDPAFRRLLCFDYNTSKDLTLKMVCYDPSSKPSKDPNTNQEVYSMQEKDLVGISEVSLRDLLHQHKVKVGGAVKYPLKCRKVKEGVTIEITVAKHSVQGKVVSDSKGKSAPADQGGYASSVPKLRIPAANAYVLTMKVSCRDLVKMDMLSKSDPVANFYVQNQQSKNFEFAGQTELIMNNHNPDFQREYKVRVLADTARQIRVSIFDVDSTSKDKSGQYPVSEKSAMGHAIVDLQQVMRNAQQGKETRLRLEKAKKGEAIIRCLACEPTSAPRIDTSKSMSSINGESVTLGIACTGLRKDGAITGTNPVVEVSMRERSGGWRRIGQTERHKRELNPNFSKRIRVPIAHSRQEIRFEVFDCDNPGQIDPQTGDELHNTKPSSLLGSCVVTAGHFIGEAGRTSERTVIYPMTDRASKPQLALTLHAHDSDDNSSSSSSTSFSSARPLTPPAQSQQPTSESTYFRAHLRNTYRRDENRVPWPLLEISVDDPSSGHYRSIGRSDATEAKGSHDDVSFAKVFQIPATSRDRKVRVRAYDCGLKRSDPRDEDMIGTCTLSLLNFIKEARRNRAGEVEYDLQTPQRGGRPSVLVLTQLSTEVALQELRRERDEPRPQPNYGGPKPIQLWVQCRDLIYMDRNSNSNPLVAVYVEDVHTHRFKYIGQTEKVCSRHNPKFVKGFVIRPEFNVDQRIKFVIYDIEQGPRSDGKGYELRQEDEIGATVASLQKLKDKLGKSRNYSEYPLSHSTLPSDQTSLIRVAVGDEHDRVPWEGSPTENNLDEYGRDRNRNRNQAPSRWGLDNDDRGQVFSSQRRFRVDCRDLPKSNRHSLCDSVVVLFTKQPPEQTFRYVAVTERIQSSLSPSFLATFLIKQYEREDTEFKWVVFDVEDSRNFNRWTAELGAQAERQDATADEPWRRHVEGAEIVGMVDMRMSSFNVKVESSPEAQVDYHICNALGEPVNRGRAYLLVKELAVNHRLTNQAKVRFTIACSALPKMDRFSQSDPLVAVFLKSHENGEYRFLAQTERLINNHFPQFQAVFTVDELMEEDQQLKFIVYDIEDVHNMNMEVDFTINRDKKPTQDIMGVAQCSLKFFLDQARQSSEGKVDFKILNEDGAQVNDHRAFLTITLEEYATVPVPHDRTDDSKGASRDWRGMTTATHYTNNNYMSTQDGRSTSRSIEVGDMGHTVDMSRTTAVSSRGGLYDTHTYQPEQPLMVWIKYHNERPIQAPYTSTMVVDTFEADLLKELRHRYGPRIYSIAMRKVPNRRPGNSYSKPLPEVCEGNMPMVEVARGVTFDNPLVVVSRAQEGRVGDGMGGEMGLVKTHEAYLASQEKMRRETFKSNIIWTLLWNKKYKLRVTIPETFVFCNGRFACRMFSSRKNNEITKVRAQSTNLHKLRTRLANLAREDPINTTSLVAVANHDDSRVSSVPIQMLPRVLRELVMEPMELLTSSLGEPVIAQWKLVKQFFKPVGNVRYVCEYTAMDQRSSHTRDFFPSSQKWTPNGPNARTPRARGKSEVGPQDEYEMVTKIHTFTSRYKQSSIDLDGDYDRLDENEEDPLTDDEYIDPFGNRLHTNGARSDVNEFEMRATDINKAVPDVIVRESRRCTLAVVDYLLDVQGLDITHIKCEFVQRFDKRLVLHDLYEVEFRDEVSFDHVLDDMMDNEMPISGSGLHGGHDGGISREDLSSSRKPVSASRGGKRREGETRPFNSRWEKTQRRNVESNAAEVTECFLPDRAFESQKEADERRHRGERFDPNLPLQSDVKVNWKRAAKQAHTEVLALNNELLVKEKRWHAARVGFLKRLEAREAKVNHADRTAKQLKEQNRALEGLVDDLRIESDQQNETVQRLERMTADLNQELMGNERRLGRMKDDTYKDTGLIEKLQQENDAQRAQIEELCGGAKQGGAALNIAQKVRDQLLEKLQIEEEKTAQFAQLLDLVREFTPKYYDTVRILLDEARGTFNTDGSNSSILDKYVFDSGWGRLKHKIAKAYRQSVKDMKRDGPMGSRTASRRAASAGSTLRRSGGATRGMSGSSSQESTLMRHFSPSDDEDEMKTTKKVKGYHAERNMTKWAGKVSRGRR